jgi:FtsP/CotA-like multicopper oxidase with cupredoxin domain
MGVTEMGVSRRFFVGAALAAGAGLAGGFPRPLLASSMPLLNAQVKDIQLAPARYPQTRIWSYGGGMPGTEIRLPQGQTVRRRLENALPQATSVHWHGIRSDNAMDGVAGLTQPAVLPGAGFDYEFTAPDAGTFWYHAHNRSAEQVARGLYGVLIVEEPDGPDVDRDEVLVLDDWLLNPETGQLGPDFATPADRSHGGRQGNFITTNGQYALSLPAARHERLRLRIINAANARIFVLGLAGFDGWRVAADGMPLPVPLPVSGDILLGPGQRVDLIVDVTAEVGETAYLLGFQEEKGYSLAAFPVSATGTRARRDTPKALPANPKQVVTGLKDALRARLNLTGGAMRLLDAAILNGARRSYEQLKAAGKFWAFNGTVGMTDTPLVAPDLGQTVRLMVNNDTAYPHALHLHGMHFREILPDGSLGNLRDTLLTFGGEIREIAFMADNPGDWLFHCHMLSHAESGMVTWVKVNA